MWPCLYNAGLLHVVIMKFLMVFVENDANHV